MEVVHAVCCGIDVHQKEVVVCLRRVHDGVVQKVTRRFGTALAHLRELAAWLREEKCPVVGMESTGVYWRPVYHVLSPVAEVIVGNPRDMHRRPGKKTDGLDADWISELLAHGLISPSFVPSAEQRALRDLTRTRVTLVQVRSQAKNRVHKLLEDTNIKLSSVVSDLFGKSGRAMLDALVAGERCPQALAELALGRLRKKVPQLELALDGMFTEHHAALIKMSLAQVDQLEQQISEIEVRIEALVEKMAPQIAQFDGIPGVDRTAAIAVLAETGTDMSRYVAPKRLASWSGVCPGNNESAGKRHSGRTRRGNKWIRRVLTQCAWAARKTDTAVGRRFRTLQTRIGGKKAALATAHQILTIGYHLLVNGAQYEDEKAGRLNPRLEVRRRNNAVQLLCKLGYKVTLDPVTESTTDLTGATDPHQCSSPA
jgi:transposase